MSNIDLRTGRLRLRDLQCFISVANSANMARAAIEMGTAQSSVSNSIAAIEEATGALLFNRRAHGVELTHRGKSLLPRVKNILADLNIALDSPNEDSDTGTIKIGSTAPLISTLIAPATVSFCRWHPKMTVSIVDGLRTDLPGMVIDRALDMCFCRRSDALVHDSLDAIDLMPTSLSVYAGKNHPLASRNAVSLSDMADVKWCLPRADHPYRPIIDAMFAANHLPPPAPAISTANSFVIWEAIATGEYLTVMASESLKALQIMNELQFREPSARMTTAVSSLITLKGRPLSSAAKKFAQHLIAHAQGLKQAAEEIPNIVL